MVLQPTQLFVCDSWVSKNYHLSHIIHMCRCTVTVSFYCLYNSGGSGVTYCHSLRSSGAEAVCGCDWRVWVLLHGKTWYKVSGLCVEFAFVICRPEGNRGNKCDKGACLSCCLSFHRPCESVFPFKDTQNTFLFSFYWMIDNVLA